MAQANKWRVYIQPYDEFGNYTGTWVEVTDYVELDSLGTIDRALDNTDYNIGIYRNSDFQMTLRNDDGRFSDVGGPTSMFRWTRSNSLVKITWTADEFADTNGLVCGFFEAGNAILTAETQIFLGLLSDKALSMDLNQQVLQFTILGLETIFTNIFVPFVAMVSSFGMTFDLDGSQFLTGTPGYIEEGTDPPLLGSPLVGLFFQFELGSAAVLPNELTASTYTIDLSNSSGSTSNNTYYGLAGTLVSGGWRTTVASSLSGSATNFSGSPTGTITLIPVASTSNNTFAISEAITAILNQASITKLITIGSITVGQDANLDDWSGLNGKTVWDALSDLLLMSNSVLSINGSTLTVSPRTPSADLKYTFYGQGSILGQENIQDIQNITSGIARMFNYLSWKASSSNIPVSFLTGNNIPETVSVQNGVSIAKYGATPKNLNLSYVVDIHTADARKTLLLSLLDEFGAPKQEFDLYTPLSQETLALTLLDKVAIDYPVVNTPTPGQMLPICGEAVCGEAWLPSYSNFSFIESPNNFYKIEGVSIDPQSDLICFSMRRV